MNTKLEKLLLNDEAGEVIEVTPKQYVTNIIKELKVTGFEEGGRPTDAQTIVEHFLKQTHKGQEIDEVFGNRSEYNPVLERVREDYKTNTANLEKLKKDSASDAEKAKAAKEATKKAEEENKLALVARQDGISDLILEGSKVALGEAKNNLKLIEESLPDGVEFITKGKGVALAFKEGMTDAEKGKAAGYVIGQAVTNQALGNLFQFMIGDMINMLSASGLYTTQKEAAAHVSKSLGLQDSKTSIGSESSLSYYAKMAERTPLELRNPEAQPTAYLAIANMALPKKGDNETDADFKTRKAKFESDREELQKKLASGEIKERKDVLDLVEKILVDNGIKKPKSTDVVDVTELLKQKFHAESGLENFLDTHEEGLAVYVEGSKADEIKKHRLSKLELEDLRDTATASLNNIFYSTKKPWKANFDDYANGYITTEVKEVKAKGKDGAEKGTKEVRVNIYPQVWWDVTGQNEGKDATPAEAEAPAKKEAPVEKEVEEAVPA